MLLRSASNPGSPRSWTAHRWPGPGRAAAGFRVGRGENHSTSGLRPTNRGRHTPPSCVRSAVGEVRLSETSGACEFSRPGLPASRQHLGALLEHDIHRDATRAEAGQILLQHAGKLAPFRHEPGYAGIVAVTLKTEDLSGKRIDGGPHLGKVDPIPPGGGVACEGPLILKERELRGIA